MKSAALLLGLALLISADRSFAYCRTSHCPATGKDSHVCTPALPDDCGFVVYWPKPRVTYSVQLDASSQVSFETIRTTLRRSFDTWLNVDCGGGKHPRFEAIEADPVECHLHEYNKDRGNANIVLFHDDVWPYGDHDGRLALTTVSYNTETGEIYDADMEINSAHANFTTSDLITDIDLLSVVTHEAGHFLGLAHSPDTSATMFASYKAGSRDQRDLTDDDIAGICATHPPGEIAEDCDPTPRHGFSTVCRADQASAPEEPPEVENCCCPDGTVCDKGACVADEGGCCTIAPGGGATRSGPAATLAALAGMALYAARRRTRRRR